MVDEDSTTWWQSINQPANSKDHRINITIRFNKTYILAEDISITFNSGRPEQMILEKSTDYGVTWKPLQYYARNCAVFSSLLLPGAAVTASDPTAVTCTNRYVEVVTRPPAWQTVKFPLRASRFSLFLGPNEDDFVAFYTALENKLLDFLKFTDLRVQLIQPATDGRGVSDVNYYGIADFRVPAWCDCNLHAAYCNFTEAGVVCDCQHNTMGQDCNLCLPLHNERPWQRGSYLPYPSGTANECTMCECNDHALSCVYNATYGRGVCQACLHNTRGYHCQLCVDTYYPNVSLPLSDPHICIDCDCDQVGVFNNSRTCAQVDNPPEVIGQCPCRPLVGGRRCDQCIPGYYGLKDGPSPGNCTACNCTSDGTVGQSNVCQQSGGQCPCKPHIVGRVCHTCAHGFFSFPSASPQSDCLPCSCDKGGSTGQTCDKTSGQCPCKANITGVKCNQVAAGSFVPMIDILAVEPASGGCEVTSDLYTPQHPFDGVGFAVCNVSTGNVSVQLGPIVGGMIQKDAQWPYMPAVRYSTSRSDIAGTLKAQVTGNTQAESSVLAARLGANVNTSCPLAVGSNYQVTLTFPPGQSTASVSRNNNLTLDIRCQYSMTLELYRYVSDNSPTNATASGQPTTNVTNNGNSTASGNTTTNLPANGNTTTNLPANGNTTTNLPANGNTTTNSSANGNTTANLPANGVTNRKKREVLLDSGPPFIIDSVVLLPGLSNTDGTVAFLSYAQSDNQTEMQDNYRFCLQQVAALSTRQQATEQSPCKDLFLSLQAELYSGARACDCNPVGTVATLGQSCQSLGGQCPCQPGVSGRSCDRCTPGYFNLTSSGCTPCPTLPCEIPDPPATTTTSPATTTTSSATTTTSPETTTLSSNTTEKENTTVAFAGASDHEPLGAGFIALIIIAAVVFIVVCALVVLFVSRRVRRNKSERNEIYHIPRCHLATEVPVEHTEVGLQRQHQDIARDNCSFKRAQPASPAAVELEVCSYDATATESSPYGNLGENNNGVPSQKSHFHTFYTFGDVPLSQSSPKEGKHLLQIPSVGRNNENSLQDLQRQRSFGGNLYDPHHNQNIIRSKSLDELPEAEKMFKVSPEPAQYHGNNLRKWMPKPDLRVSGSDREDARDSRESKSSADQPGFPPRTDVHSNDNVSDAHVKDPNKLQLKEKPQEKNKRKSPQKPVRQRQPDGEDPSVLNKIWPPPPMYDDIPVDSFTDPDYDSMDDSRVLIARPGARSLSGSHNPVFIPEPDYPSYADFTSFDEINGSLV
ncbi:hypothetical protein BsWGS_08701 [Bradybaena similaris]